MDRELVLTSGVQANPQVPLTSSANASRMFPVLMPGQIARIAAHGVTRPITRGEVLLEPRQSDVPFFVVGAGAIEVSRDSGLGETVIAVIRPGQFTGEVSMILGRPAVSRLRACQDGEVVQLTRDQMHALIQTDAELSEVLMRAFMYRRIELVARGIGDALLLGSAQSPATLRIRAFLTRNAHPFRYLDLDRDAEVRDVLARFNVDPLELPVLICRGESVLRNPGNQVIAEHLGFNDGIDQVHLRDVVIVGAGPAGLAAAVYAASEGLDVLVVEASSPGGQAGASSRIENYLGFPTGVSGQDLAGRAYAQAQKFGAAVMIAKGAAALACDRVPYRVRLEEGGATIAARSVIIATGARYRKPTLANLAQFEGAGVYYNATAMEETQLGEADEVIVVGGGNSAGQAAMFLARAGRRVHMLVRTGGLAASMSRYLIRRIDETPAIELRTRTELVALEGDTRLARVRWRDESGAITTRAIKHVFLMTGAEANTAWLNGGVALDGQGFIKTGHDLTAANLTEAKWPLERLPYPLETSIPGVFAAGDVRCGNIRRVASAVGEGSIAISYVHRALADRA